MKLRAVKILATRDPSKPTRISEQNEALCGLYAERRSLTPRKARPRTCCESDKKLAGREGFTGLSSVGPGGSRGKIGPRLISHGQRGGESGVFLTAKKGFTGCTRVEASGEEVKKRRSGVDTRQGKLGLVITETGGRGAKAGKGPKPVKKRPPGGCFQSKKFS